MKDKTVFYINVDKQIKTLIIQVCHALCTHDIPTYLPNLYAIFLRCTYNIGFYPKYNPGYSFLTLSTIRWFTEKGIINSLISPPNFEHLLESDFIIIKVCGRNYSCVFLYADHSADRRGSVRIRNHNFFLQNPFIEVMRDFPNMGWFEVKRALLTY